MVEHGALNVGMRRALMVSVIAAGMLLSSAGAATAKYSACGYSAMVRFDRTLINQYNKPYKASGGLYERFSHVARSNPKVSCNATLTVIRYLVKLDSRHRRGFDPSNPIRDVTGRLRVAWHYYGLNLAIVAGFGPVTQTVHHGSDGTPYYECDGSVIGKLYRVGRKAPLTDVRFNHHWFSGNQCPHNLAPPKAAFSPNQLSQIAVGACGPYYTPTCYISPPPAGEYWVTLGDSSTSGYAEDWDFGDGTHVHVSNGATPPVCTKAGPQGGSEIGCHIFHHAGTYQITLVVSGDGKSDTTTHAITVQ